MKDAGGREDEGVVHDEPGTLRLDDVKIVPLRMWRGCLVKKLIREGSAQYETRAERSPENVGSP